MAWYSMIKKAVRKITVLPRLNITDTGGLIPPKKKSAASPFLWTLADGIIPETIRWVWLPTTGEMKIGPANAHAEQISGTFDAWLRGFYFPAKKTFAIRSYYWPRGPYDDWDAEHAELNNKITQTITPMLLSQVPGAKIEGQVDNQWLKNKIDPFRRW